MLKRAILQMKSVELFTDVYEMLYIVQVEYSLREKAVLMPICDICQQFDLTVMSP